MKKHKCLTGILAGALAVSTLLSGCGGNSAPANSAGAASAGASGSAEVTKLTFWYAWKDQIEENNKERVQEFNETVGKEKGIEVTAEYQGSYTDLHSKLQSAFVANEEPAVSVMGITSIKTFADGGIIQPLTDLVAEEDIKDFYPGLMENCYVDNTLYGVPYLRSTPVLYYNKTLFKKAGLDPEKGPSDWDELTAMSKQLEKAGVKGYGFLSDEWHYEAFIRSNGGDTLNKEQNKATFNEQPGIEMAEYLRNGIKNSNFKEPLNKWHEKGIFTE